MLQTVVQCLPNVYIFRSGTFNKIKGKATFEITVKQCYLAQIHYTTIFCHDVFCSFVDKHTIIECTYMSGAGLISRAV